MSESTTPSSENSSTSKAAQIGWGLLICVTLYVCYFSHLGAIGFVGPDEPRYAWIARDMMESGDWVTPRLYGKPWFEKPPLLYWGAGLCFKWFGVSETSARLPSAISALLATLALAWLARKFYGAETARWLLLLLPTTVGMIGFSHAAATDMPFSGMLTIAMVCAAVILGLTRDENTPILPRMPWLVLVSFGLVLGLAVLAKGPAAIVLCGGAVFFWALFTKRWGDGFRLLHPVAIASFCATALPWYILCARRNPDFFRVFIIEHNFQRYLTPEFQHVQPFWYYGPIAILGLLPWASTVFFPLRDGFRSVPGGRWLHYPGLFVFCCALWPITFFSLSKSKLPGYILPSILFSGVLFAQSFSLRVRKIVPGERWIALAAGATWIALGVFAFIQVEWIPFTLASVFLLGGGFSAVVMAVLGRSSWALIIAQVALVVALFVGVEGDARWALDSAVSSRYALRTAPLIWKDYSPEHTSTYRLQRAFSYSLNFYLHRELPEWSPNDRRPGWIFTSPSNAHELKNLGLNCVQSSFRSGVAICEDQDSVEGRANRGQVQKKE